MTDLTLQHEPAPPDEPATDLKSEALYDLEANRRVMERQQAECAARTDAEKAEREGDLERAAQLRYGTMRDLEAEIETKTQRLNELQSDQQMLKEEVDEEDVAEIVSKWTGIPVSRLMEGEMAKLVRMEDVLHARVIGQDEPVTAVAACTLLPPSLAILVTPVGRTTSSMVRFPTTSTSSPSRGAADGARNASLTPAGSPGRQAPGSRPCARSAARRRRTRSRRAR